MKILPFFKIDKNLFRLIHQKSNILNRKRASNACHLLVLVYTGIEGLPRRSMIQIKFLNSDPTDGMLFCVCEDVRMLFSQQYMIF